MDRNEGFHTGNSESIEQQKAFLLSSNPNKAMQQMMEIIDSLRNVYVEENKALLSSDTKSFLGLQDKKIAAARDYQNCSQQLLDHKGGLQHIDDALKEQLISKQDKFSGIVSENLKALERLRKGVTRLNERVVRSARQAARTNNMNYRANGHLETNERAISMGVSESA